MARPRRFLPLVLALGLLLPPSGGPATAASGKMFEYLVRSFIKSMKAGTKVTAKTARTRFATLAKSVPGLDAAFEALAKRAGTEEELERLAKAMADEVTWQLSRQGVSYSEILACSQCVGTLLLVPDAFIRSDQVAVRMAMGNELAGMTGQGPLRNLDAQGKPVFGPVSNNEATRRAVRGALADVLAEVLAELRKARVGETEFEATATKKLAEQATAKPKSRDLKSITYDDAKGTLSFELEIGRTKVSVKELNVKLYLERLKNLLVYGGGGAGGTAVLLSHDDTSPAAESAREKRAQALTAECGKTKGNASLTLTQPPPQCGKGLSQDDKATINRDTLTTLDCAKNTGACNI